MPRGQSSYGGYHQRAREALLKAHPWCQEPGCRRPSRVADHFPPLRLHRTAHVDGSGCCWYRAQCIDCSRRQGGHIAQRLRAERADDRTGQLIEPDPSPGPADGCWDVLPWLESSRDVPGRATWPRFMTLPHPAAVGSLIDEFAVFVRQRTGKELLWFQRLAAARVLEVDSAGRLVWLSWFLTVARQLGKSFLVGNLLLFMLVRAGDLWPAVQADLLYASRTLLSAESLVRGLLRWALEAGSDWSALRANGQKSVSYRDEHSMLIRAVDSVYGETCGLAVVDESWDVAQASIDESILPATLAAEGQIGYTSTAHRRATSMCLQLREFGLATLHEPDELLLLEWSAAPWRELDDEEGWRESSPEWTEGRHRRLSSMLERARGGVSADPTEPDPLAGFESQGLNRWPARTIAQTRTELVLPAEVWARCAGRSVTAVGAGWCAVNNDRLSAGASVAFAAQDAGGVFEVDGIECESWEDALRWARKFVEASPGSRMAVGADMFEQVPRDFPGRTVMRRAGSTETRRGLSLLRSLVAEGRVVHEGTPDLDVQLGVARVRRPGGWPDAAAGVAGRSVEGGVVGVVVRSEAAGHAEGGVVHDLIDQATTVDNRWVRSPGFETRALIPRDTPNDNDPAEHPPGTVGPQAAPGDPEGVVLISEGTPSPWPRSVVRPSPWSGWPAEWETPLWGNRVAELTDTAWTCVDLNARSCRSCRPISSMPCRRWMPTG